MPSSSTPAKKWRNGSTTTAMLKSNTQPTGSLRYWKDGNTGFIYLFTISGQPYILRVQGVPGMRTFSQLGHGGL